jgi:hypothetical protein
MACRGTALLLLKINDLYRESKRISSSQDFLFLLEILSQRSSPIVYFGLVGCEAVLIVYHLEDGSDTFLRNLDKHPQSSFEAGASLQTKERVLHATNACFLQPPVANGR